MSSKAIPSVGTRELPKVYTPYSSGGWAACVIKVAAYCQKPIFYAVSCLSRIRSPMLIGKYDFCDTKAKEIAFRILCVPMGLGSFIIGIPCAILAVIFGLAGCCLQKTGFTYFHGKASEKSFKGSFKAMSWNVCGMPDPFSRSAGGMVAWTKREDAIVQMVKDQNPDLLFLQEAFDVDFTLRLVKRLKNEFAHFFVHNGFSIFQLSSGLFVASKFPIENYQFIPFNSKKYGMYKGFSLFSIGKGNQTKWFVCTHLAHGKDNDATTQRENQLQQILTKMRRSEFFLAGDLNINLGSNEYQGSSLCKLFKHAEESDVTYSDVHEQYLNGKEKIEPEEKKLDYISVFGKAAGHSFEGEVIELPSSRIPASDHLPVVAMFS